MASTTNCRSMPSVLPLLFAGGYPTSLEKITESQLEKFIPFMVQCSQGNINNTNAEYSRPEWWPDSVPFSVPLQRPTYGTGWLKTLKTIVEICYSFHKSRFLLQFCQQLGAYRPESLRFMGHCNNTTSLYERSSNKLLVTFRNANMLYDQITFDRTGKMTLMSSRKDQSLSKPIDEVVDTVETVFEIYLCDNCEAELYSKDAYDEHEKTCQQDDDDVIFCGEEFLTNHLDNKFEEQANFLANFSLLNPKFPLPNQLRTPVEKCVEQSSTTGEKRSNPRCNKIVLNSNVPFSSPAGQQLLKLSKSQLDPSYAIEKLEHTERYCSAPPMDCNNLSDLIKPIKYNRIPLTYSRPKTYRRYTFPRRQFSQYRYREASLEWKNDQLKMNQPMSIELMRLFTQDTEKFNSQDRNETMIKNNDVATNQSAIVIDLCSDDDDDQGIPSSHHDDGNISQMAVTPVSSFVETSQMPFDMFAMTSSHSTTSMFNSAMNYQYQHHESHQRFLNGAQGSTTTQVDRLTKITDISIQFTPSAGEESHISINLSL